jgi:nucleotide-binding universal stress UspA family protein
MYRKILVPLDGSATAEHGLRAAIGLASGLAARLHLLHVVDDYPVLMAMQMSMPGDYEKLMQRLEQEGETLLGQAKTAASQAGVPTDAEVRRVDQRSVDEVIVNTASDRGCDLIVMGTHGRRGLRRWTMGSDAEMVVRNSPVPVLMVREESQIRQ